MTNGTPLAWSDNTQTPPEVISIELQPLGTVPLSYTTGTSSIWPVPCQHRKIKLKDTTKKTEYPCAYKCHQHQRPEKILLQAPDRPLYSITTTFSHHVMISTEDLVCDGTTVYGKY